jgi:hypothetical protein
MPALESELEKARHRQGGGAKRGEDLVFDDDDQG